jgi:hypothetical protein
MDPHTVEITIKFYLKYMRERLEMAASIARAAEACADSGNVEKSIEVALDVEQMIYEIEPSLLHQNPDIEISRPETTMKNSPARRQNAEICAAETD